MSDPSHLHLDLDDLPAGQDAIRFDGHEHGAQVSFFLSRHEPGRGPSLHRHPYEETFIMESGIARFTIGEEDVDVGKGELVVVPAGMPHKFVSLGPDQLRQISIHPVARMETEWLE
jgi:mannose-6-phosphate isomerase-like protein (cupin superfamily)